MANVSFPGTLFSIIHHDRWTSKSGFLTHLCVYLSWVSAGHWVCAGSWRFWPVPTMPTTSQQSPWHAVSHSVPAAPIQPCRRHQWSRPAKTTWRDNSSSPRRKATWRRLRSDAAFLQLLWAEVYTYSNTTHGKSQLTIRRPMNTCVDDLDWPCKHQSYQWWHRNKCTDRWAA